MFCPGLHLNYLAWRHNLTLCFVRNKSRCVWCHTISPNLLWWRNKLIYILDDLRVKVHFWVNYSFRNKYCNTCFVLKVQYTQKWKFCHHLLTLKSFQTCMSFFLLLNTKLCILKNFSNQTKWYEKIQKNTIKWQRLPSTVYKHSSVDLQTGLEQHEGE